MGPVSLGRDGIPILGVQSLVPDVRVGDPLVLGVAEELADARCDVPKGGRRLMRGPRDVGHNRHSLDEGSVPMLGGVARPDLPTDVAPPDDGEHEQDQGDEPDGSHDLGVLPGIA